MRQGGPPISFRQGAPQPKPQAQQGFGGQAQFSPHQNWGGPTPMQQMGGQQQQFGQQPQQGPSKIGMGTHPSPQYFFSRNL